MGPNRSQIETYERRLLGVLAACFPLMIGLLLILLLPSPLRYGLFAGICIGLALIIWVVYRLAGAIYTEIMREDPNAQTER